VPITPITNFASSQPAHRGLGLRIVLTRILAVQPCESTIMAFAGTSMTNQHAGFTQEAALQPLSPVQRRTLPAPCAPVRRRHRALSARRSIRVRAEASEDNAIVPAELSLVRLSPGTAFVQTTLTKLWCLGLV